MKKRFFIFLLAAFACSFDAEAAARGMSERIKPEIAVKIDEGKPSYVYKRPKVSCSQSGHVLGCTHVVFFATISDADITPAGELKKLTFQIGLRDVIIELSTELKKGSCLFDVVLKHELTHLALHRRVLKRFAQEIPKAILAEAEKLSPPLTQKKVDRISSVINTYVNRMQQEDDRQNNMMDTGDAYYYQQSQCMEHR